MGAESVTTRLALQGDPPSPFDVPSGCRFHPRCPYAVDACRTTDPALTPVPLVLGTGPGGPTSVPTSADVAPTGTAHVAACIRSAELGDVDPLHEPAIEPDDPALTRPDVLLDHEQVVESTAAPATPVAHHQEEPSA